MNHPFVIVPSLSAIAIAYVQPNLIADEVLPRVPVYTETFNHLKYKLEDAFSAPDTRVGRKSAPNQITWGSELQPASVEDHALDAPVPNADVNAYNLAKQAGTGYVAQSDPLSRATKLVMQTVQNRREKRAADLVFNAASYGVDNKETLTTNFWDDYANSDPLVQIDEYLDSMVMRPTVAVFGRKVFSKLSRHPKICKAVFGNNTDAGKVSMQALAAELGMEKICIGDAWVNTAAPGQPATLVRVWGNHAAFLVRNKEADTQFGVTFGYTAQFGDQVAGTIEDPDIGMRGGQRVRAGESVKELVTANDLGFFVQNAINPAP
ncbi:major capsid protein [Variovorax boronicumulans]